MAWTRAAKLSYKAHKLGNSVVTIVPLKRIKSDDTIRYIIKDSRVKVIKDVATNNIESTISETVEQYNELLTELVDL